MYRTLLLLLCISTSIASEQFCCKDGIDGSKTTFSKDDKTTSDFWGSQYAPHTPDMAEAYCRELHVANTLLKTSQFFYRGACDAPKTPPHNYPPGQTVTIQGTPFPVVPARKDDGGYCHEGAECAIHSKTCYFTKNSIKCGWHRNQCVTVDVCGNEPVCWEIYNKWRDYNVNEWDCLNKDNCAGTYREHGACCEAFTHTCYACKMCLSEEDYCKLPVLVRDEPGFGVPPGCYCYSGTVSIAGDTFSPCNRCQAGWGNGVGGNTPCTECPAGTANPIEAGVCEECPYPTLSAAGALECVNATVLTCGEGQKWTPPTNTLDGSCAHCPAGTHGPEADDNGETAQTFCTTCPHGSYTDTQGEIACTVCPDDTTTTTGYPGVGSTDASDCTDCADDEDCRVRTTENDYTCRRERALAGACEGSPDNGREVDILKCEEDASTWNPEYCSVAEGGREADQASCIAAASTWNNGFCNLLGPRNENQASCELTGLSWEYSSSLGFYCTKVDDLSFHATQFTSAEECEAIGSSWNTHFGVCADGRDIAPCTESSNGVWQPDYCTESEYTTRTACETQGTWEAGYCTNSDYTSETACTTKGRWTGNEVNLGCRSTTAPKDDTGKNWCYIADADHEAAGQNWDYCTVACPPGEEPVLVAETGSAWYECAACADGKKNNEYDDSVCTVCGNGEFTDDKKTCTNCTETGAVTWIDTLTGHITNDACQVATCAAGYKLASHKCTACDAEQHSAEGSTACTDDTFDANNCAANTHFVEGTDHTDDDAECADDSTQQTDCAAGTYYVPGTASSTLDDSACSDCAANQYSAAGAASCTDDGKADADDCGNTQYFTVGTSNTADDGTCTDCTEPTAQQYTTTTCGNSATDRTADTVVGDCSAPGTGKYTSTVCAHGDSANAGTNTQDTTCTTCTAGKYIAVACSAGTATLAGSNTDCQNCAAGTHTSQADQSSCTDCTDGTNFASSAGASSCTGCATPGSKKYVSTACTKNANTQLGDCNEAGTGEYQENACTQGSAGSAGNAGSVQSCSNNCAAGKKQTNCVQGSWNSAGSDRSCADCPANKYSASGDTGCTNCAANTASTAGSASCTACNAGQASASGQACSNCAAGKTSTAGGSCTACAANQYSAAGDASCSNCAAGKTSSAGSSSCSNCAAGKTSTAGGACGDCAAGTYAASGDVSCTACANGKYSAAGAGSCTDHTSCHANRLTGASTTAAGTCPECGTGTYAAQDTDDCQAHTSCGNQVGGATRLTSATATAAGSCADCSSGSYAANGASNCQSHTSCGNQGDGSTRLTGASTTAAGSCAACGTGTYAADATSNCADHTSCGNKKDGTTRLTGASATAAGSCAACTGNTWAADATSNCADHSTSCNSGKYISAAADATADITCTACATCSGTKYASGGCTGSTNTICTERCSDGTSYSTQAACLAAAGSCNDNSINSASACTGNYETGSYSCSDTSKTSYHTCIAATVSSGSALTSGATGYVDQATCQLIRNSATSSTGTLTSHSWSSSRPVGCLDASSGDQYNGAAGLTIIQWSTGAGTSCSEYSCIQLTGNTWSANTATRSWTSSNSYHSG